MTITNRLNLPEGIVKAVTLKRHNKEGCLSATTLLKGAKEIILEQRHWDELEDDAADRIWAVFGQAVHALLEHEGETDFTELDLSHDLHNDGLALTVTGRIDNYDMRTGTITDYKTASIWKLKNGDFSDWQKQGLVYAWLLHKNNFPAKKVRFIALLKDHKKSSGIKNPVYIYEYDVTPKLLETIDRVIKAKVSYVLSYEMYEDDVIPPCEENETWNGRKCKHYCLVSNYCNGGKHE